MKLWVDADATPRDVKEIVFRAADRLRLEAVLVANQRVPLPLGYATLTAVRVDGGPDVADRYIAEHAAAGDVAVTADIPLAATLVAKGVAVLDPRGVGSLDLRETRGWDGVHSSPHRPTCPPMAVAPCASGALALAGA
jgi:uncharacterized protein YaiI (UPF0178 family)